MIVPLNESEVNSRRLKKAKEWMECMCDERARVPGNECS